PLLLAHGRLERHQEGATQPVSGVRDLQAPVYEADGELVRPVINLLVSELEPLERLLDGGLGEDGAAAVVKRLRGARRPAAAEPPGGVEGGSSMRAVARPIESFAAGRRR